MGLISRVSSRTYRTTMSNILVIGTNRGIGLELARQLATRQTSTIFATCRTPSKSLEEISNITVIPDIDLSNDSVIQKLKSITLPNKIDGVIINSGVLVRNAFDDLDDTSSLAYQFQTNSLGPLRVVRGIIDKLGEGSKIAIVTSRMGSVSDNGSGGHYGYRMSKSAVNMAAKSLSVDLKDKGIAVGLLHPGYVRTDMTNNQGFIDATESAEGLLKRFDELNIDNTGTFWHMNGEVLPW